MNALTFAVVVRQPGQAPITLLAVGSDSAGLIMAMQDRYGPCRVSVKPK